MKLILCLRVLFHIFSMAAGIFKNLDNQSKKKINYSLSLQRLGRLLWYPGVPLDVPFLF